MKKAILFISLIFCLPFVLMAQTAKEEITSDVNRTGSNYYAYPAPTGTLTAPPKGYEPFYFSHYARHGSRYLVDSMDYIRPLQVMKEADSYHVLTPLGKEVLDKLDNLYQMSKGKYGELTPLGARQHRGIAQRIYQNFPEIFGEKGNIYVRSSVIVRCILSMTAECLQLQSLNPELSFTNEANANDMWLLSNEPADYVGLRNAEAITQAYQDFRNKHLHPERLMQSLFNASDYVKWKVDSDQFMYQLFRIAQNMQSHDVDMDFYSIFTRDELYDLWCIDNYEWYLNYGPSPVSNGKIPYVAADLLKDFIQCADKCIKDNDAKATLRFGHEVCVMPLACLMELGDCARQIQDAEALADAWRNYHIFPMASNIQWIFYKGKTDNDILVKILLNEKEMTLPVESDIAPYYSWEKVRAYYLQKIKDFVGCSIN